LLVWRARRGGLRVDGSSPFRRVAAGLGEGGRRRRGRGREEGRELMRRRDRHPTSISRPIPRKQETISISLGKRADTDEIKTSKVETHGI